MPCSINIRIFGKERKMLLQIRKTIDSDSLIDLIAMGLPNEIIEKIDREKLLRPEDLHNEIGKLEYLATKKNKDTKKTKPCTDNKKNKTPCKICKDKEKVKGSILRMNVDLRTKTNKVEEILGVGGRCKELSSNSLYCARKYVDKLDLPHMKGAFILERDRQVNT
ncbi:hypothetical protein HHI36_009016 [Cryptolaemus montrouzieri]|uniref:Uncharacterized protein n=1 Tax=Cryptolaemus montrouzieri TaxID=559131 RepID=A0ABD2MU65_9CUCU